MPLTCAPRSPMSLQAGAVSTEGSGLAVSGTDSGAMSLQRSSLAAFASANAAGAAASIITSSNAIQQRTVTLSFTSLRHGQTTSLLRVAVHPRPYPVHRTIRFFHAENEYLRAVLPAPPSGSASGVPTSMQVRFDA